MLGCTLRFSHCSIPIPSDHTCEHSRAKPSHCHGAEATTAPATCNTRCEGGVGGLQARHRRMTAQQLPDEALERILARVPTVQERCGWNPCPTQARGLTSTCYCMHVPGMPSLPTLSAASQGKRCSRVPCRAPASFAAEPAAVAGEAEYCADRRLLRCHTPVSHMQHSRPTTASHRVIGVHCVDMQAVSIEHHRDWDSNFGDDDARPDYSDPDGALSAARMQKFLPLQQWLMLRSGSLLQLECSTAFTLAVSWHFNVLPYLQNAAFFEVPVC